MAFQTKVDPEYLRQIQARPLQEQWLSAQLEDLGLRISKFNNVRAADQSNYMAITTSAIECTFLLKTTLLEPAGYEKLYEKVSEFLVSLRQYFSSITENPLGRIMSPYQLYVFVQRTTIVIPRLYLMALAASIWLEHLNNARKFLHSNPDTAPAELLKIGMPTTMDDIRELKTNIVLDLHEFCRGVQNPLRHLFLRHYIVEVLRPHLDFDLSEPYVVVADVDITLDFLLRNYIEMNRFWVRTQYDPARTRKEADRRDKRRIYLSEMISTGFKEIAKLCTIDGLQADVLVEVLRQIKLSSDPMSTATILEGVCAHININKLFVALDDVFAAVVSGCHGVKSFIILLDRLSMEKEKITITEELYKRFCEAGTGLCNTVLQEISTKGLEHVDKVTGMIMDSAWISCINALLVFSSRVWPEDMTKLMSALNVLIGIIFPQCSEQHIRSYAEQIENRHLPQIQPVQLLERDDDSIVKTLTSPLIRMKASMMPEYLRLLPSRALKCYLMQKSDRLMRDFSLGVAYALLENPLTVSAEEYARNNERALMLGKFCFENVYTLAHTDCLLFAKCIQSFHAALDCYNMLMNPNYELPEEAKADIYPSLFYVCHRDGFLREAGKVANLMDDIDQQAAVKLHIDNTKSIIEAMNGSYFSTENFTKDDVYNELAAAILVYECFHNSKQQCQILCEMMSVVASVKLPEGEEDAILNRFLALASVLLLRKDRPVVLAKCSQLFRVHQRDERSRQAESLARTAQAKWGDADSQKRMEIFLSN